jgi:Leucine-rich repeat (LRR) protein
MLQLWSESDKLRKQGWVSTQRQGGKMSRMIFFLQRIALVLIGAFCPTFALTPSSQILGLEFLFNSTHGTNWRWKPEVLYGPKWSFSSPQSDPCNYNNKAWQGITCSSPPNICKTQECEIVTLVLVSYDLEGSLPAEFFSKVTSLTALQISESKNLTGSIPSEISFMSQLSQITMTSNQLTGSLPSEITRLSRLKTMVFPGNNITGSLPSELRLLSLLNVLSLNSNQLTGSIPSELGFLSQLNLLALYSNHLTGTLPSILGSLPRLNILYLDSNLLNGTIPSELGSLPLLKELFLHSNQLTGSIPPELGSLSRLSYLYLYFNRLTGSIPSELGALSEMSYLSLNANSLTGPIPSELGSLTGLRELYLYYNHLTGPLPSKLGSLTLLNELFVYVNNLTGSIPSEISLLTELNALGLHFNRFTGTIPTALSSLSLVTEFYLHSNQLSGTIPSELSALSRLRYFALNSNQLTGSIPSELSLLPLLNTLNLFRNRLTGTLPPELGRLSQLSSLVLAYNLLTGTIPLSLTSFPALKLFFLDDNRFTGTVPAALSSLSQLSILSLNYNRFSGAIPSEICSLSLLAFLSLSFNQLSGTFPPELSLLSQLKNLDLSFNHLTGTLPNDLSLSSELLYLYLHMNRFSGTIPSSLSQFTRLNFLSLNSNQFTGKIPSELSSLSQLHYLYLYSNELTGVIPPSFASSFLELIYLLLSSNSLTGPIPSDIGLMTSLEELDLSQNILTGTIPSSVLNLKKLVRLRFYQNKLNGEINFPLTSFPSLQQLFLQQNHFHGPLHQLFLSPTNTSLSNHPLLNFDVSDNRFSDSIPSQLFLLPQLQSVSLSLNCFENKLPSSICEAVSVGVISMSGLGTSSSCKHVVNVPFTSVSLVQTMDGSIPDCVWLLSNLKMLNLAGNGLSGTLSETSSMPHLLSLILSHNYLSGEIPLWLQKQNMSQLDLSHNKLTGTLDGFKNQNDELDFGLVNSSLGSQFLNQTLKLSVNRLSGDLSSSLEKYATLDILSGNLFGCVHLPRNDKNSEWEICGSEEYDQSLIVMGVVCGLMIVLVTFYGLCWLITFFALNLLRNDEEHQCGDSQDNSSFFFQRRILEYHSAVGYMRYYLLTISLPHSSSSSFSSSSSSSLRSFGYLLSNLMKAMCLLTFISLILSFPIYILKVMDKESQDGSDGTEDQAQYITHFHMYRWLWTMAFISGRVPSALLLVVTFLCLMLFCFVLAVIGRVDDDPRKGRGVKPEHNDQSHESQVEVLSIASTPVSQDAGSLDLNHDGDKLNNGKVSENHKSQREFLGSGVWLVLLTNIAVVGTVNGLYLWSTLLDLSNFLRILIQFTFGLFTFVWRVLILGGSLPTRMKESRDGVRLFTYLNLVNTVVIPCVVTALSDPSCYQV